MKTLILMIGLPRSGKTTIRKELQACGIPAVCPDDLRMMIHGTPWDGRWEATVWAITMKTVLDIFQWSDMCILDATNLIKRNRDQWFSEMWETQFIYVNTPRHICLDRAFNAGNNTLAEVIINMDATRETNGFLPGDEDMFDWEKFISDYKKESNA